MANTELAPWLVEINRSPVPHQCGRPTPPIPEGLKVEKELDEAASAKLEQDFRTVIGTCEKADEADLNARILDAMTGKRLSSKQAYRLISALFRKFDECQGISRIDANGDPQPLNRWGAA
jgi:hypothetical protein